MGLPVVDAWPGFVHRGCAVSRATDDPRVRFAPLFQNRPAQIQMDSFGPDPLTLAGSRGHMHPGKACRSNVPTALVAILSCSRVA